MAGVRMSEEPVGQLTAPAAPVTYPDGTQQAE
jgi:hypothetical protein